MTMEIRSRNHIDLLLLVAVLTLMLLSLGIVYSASASIAYLKMGRSEGMLASHAAKVLLALLGMFIALRIDYHKFQRLTKPALMLAVLLLIATLAVGGETKGASRWLRLGGINFQPSEFAKYALLFHLCTLIAVKQEIIRDWKRGFVPMIVWIGTVTSLVMLQPNFSMGTMILLLSIVMLFVGRARLSHLGLTFAVLVPVILLYMLSAEYRRQRIMSYLSGVQGGAAGGTNYQAQQSLLGFACGGIFGVGPGDSKQRDFFLPESYGDFVFSIVGEEYGFLGTMFFLLLFMVILLRGFRIARAARDLFGRNLAVAITCAVILYALINAGVTLHMFPTTGLPMPFVSFGGSAMVFSACAVGVLLNISSQTDLHPRVRQVPVVGSVNADRVGAGAGKVY